MASSVTLTDAAAFRAYVQKFDFELLSRFFAGFQSKAFLSANYGVTGKLTKTELQVQDLARRYSPNFTNRPDLYKFVPRSMDVHQAKIEASINPQEFYNSYLAEVRSPGFSHNQIPFEAHILNDTFMKHSEEVDVAIWQGAAAAVPSNDDKVNALFDGFLEQIKDGLVAGDITSVGTGALTEADCVEQIESVYKALPAAMRTKEVLIYLSVANYDLYTFAYRENYSKNYTQREIDGLQQIRLDCGNAWLTPIVAMGTSNRVIATVKKNMDWGTNLESDMSHLRFQDSHWNVDMFGAYQLGCNIPMLTDTMIKVNNQE